MLSLITSIFIELNIQIIFIFEILINFNQTHYQKYMGDIK